MKEAIHFLRQVPIFATLSTLQLTEVAKIAYRRRFGRDTLILRQGEEGSSLHVVVAGRARVYFEKVNGEQATLGILGPGEFFGELAVLDYQPRRVSVAALEHCETLIIERDDLLRILRQHPDACMAMLSILCARVRRADDLLEEALTRLIGGFIPICAWCKRIRAGSGEWHPLETYIPKYTQASVTHDICPDCEARAREVLAPRQHS